jgi:predicted anti-sigma-YlaC factor YlaD
MRGWFRLALGLLAVVLGALWTVLGLGYVADSVLTDHRLFAVLGPVLVLIGLVLLWHGMRGRRRN